MSIAKVSPGPEELVPRSGFTRLTPQWLRHADGYDVRLMDLQHAAYVENRRMVHVALDDLAVVSDTTLVVISPASGRRRELNLDERDEVIARVEAGLRVMLDDSASVPPLAVEISRAELSAEMRSALDAVEEFSPRRPEEQGAVVELRRQLASLLEDAATNVLPPVGLRRLDAGWFDGLDAPIASPLSLALSRLARAFEQGFDPDVDDRFALPYRADEVEVLDRLVGVGDRGAHEVMTFDLTEAASDATFYHALTSLVDRGAVRVDEYGHVFVCHPHRLPFETMAGAELSLALELRSPDGVETTQFHVLGEIAVESIAPHQPGALVSIMDVDRVVERIVQLFRLVDRNDEIGSAATVEVDRHQIDHALRGNGQGPLGDAFRGAGVSMCRLLVGFTTTDGYASAGLAWVDASNSGLWLIEPVDAEAYESGEEPERYRAQQTSAEDVLDAILGLLPS